jgi:hypothetical protein
MRSTCFYCLIGVNELNGFLGGGFALRNRIADCFEARKAGVLGSLGLD